MTENMYYRKAYTKKDESPNYTILKINLKAFNTILKKTIRAAKYMYYESTFSRNKTNNQEHMENHK